MSAQSSAVQNRSAMPAGGVTISPKMSIPRNGVQPSMSEGERGGRHANVTQVGAQLGATVEFIPVMNAEELQRGLAEVAKG